MNAVVTWVKANVATVIFIVLMIAALVALPILSERLNASIQEEMTLRLKDLQTLGTLPKTDVEVGNPLYGTHVKRQALVTESLLARVTEVSQRESEDAKRVAATAVEHNKKGRETLLAELFPKPNRFDMDVLPERFHAILATAYNDLLANINAGRPPSLETMNGVVERRQAQFVTQTLQKAPEDPLDEAEQTQLQEALTAERRNEYGQEALNLAVYADVDVLGVPQWDQSYEHNMVDLFNWQWDYWIVQDVLEALDDANRPTNDPQVSVVQSPAKHVLELTVYPADGSAADASLHSPSAEVRPSYDVSFTGRATNPLYDIRFVDLRLVVDTARLPLVMDALAQRNFMTIVDLDLYETDPFEAERQGFVYGEEHVSEVVFRLETVWLRSWTSEFMPEEMKTFLGIPLPVPSPPADG